MGESSFWYRPTRVVPDQRPLNGRCRVYSALDAAEDVKEKVHLSGQQTVKQPDLVLATLTLSTTVMDTQN